MIYHRNLDIQAGTTHPTIQIRKLKLPESNQGKSSLVVEWARSAQEAN